MEVQQHPACNYCLSVVLYLDKGDYPENLQVVFLGQKHNLHIFGVVPFFKLQNDT